MQAVAVYASFPVIIGAFCCCFLVFRGVFDSNLGVGIGAGEYAERPDPSIYGEKLIEDLKFPANAYVNVLYSVFGTYWVLRALLIDQPPLVDVAPSSEPAASASSTKRPSKRAVDRFASDAFMTAVFGWMGVFYGPVQFLRISTQTHAWAVLDQWFTLPFFSWVCCWELVSARPSTPKAWFFLVQLVSLSSYFLTFYSAIAFDVILAAHILLAVAGALFLIKTFPERRLFTPFLRAVFCCGGFVLLKLADHRLAEAHPFFAVLSGHFWSKICDACQIHFVCLMFFNFNSFDYGKLEEKKTD